MDQSPHPTAPAALRAVTQTLTHPQLAHDDAAIALSGALAPEPGDQAAPSRWLAEWFDEAARPLFGVAAQGLRDQGAALSEAIAAWLPTAAELDDTRSLLLGPALVSRRAHPLLLSIVGHELARRAGLRSVVARGCGRDWTVLADATHCLPIGYGEVAPADLEVSQLRACCAHETSFRVARAIAAGAMGATACSAAAIASAMQQVHA